MLTDATSRRLAIAPKDQRVLIVEDEFLIALDVAETVEAMGHQVAGMASKRNHAMELAQAVDIAQVDVNLSTGRTGPAICRDLTQVYGRPLTILTDVRKSGR